MIEASHQKVDAILKRLRKYSSWMLIEADVQVMMQTYLHYAELKMERLVPGPLGDKVHRKNVSTMVHFGFFCLDESQIAEE